MRAAPVKDRLRLENGRWIVDLGQATTVRLCGGKAAGLARLRCAGFGVPATICLTTRLYRHWQWVSGARDIGPLLARARAARGPARTNLLATMRGRVETGVLPADVAAALASVVGRLGAGDGAVAVRSSAPYEDGADASHAGLHASFLVHAQDAGALTDAIRRCWASLWTEPAWTYRDRHGISHGDAAMAVVVQRFVPADRSGVAFSVDPLTHDPTTVVIEAGWGTGAALVAGKLTPDEYRVTTNGDTARVRRRPGRQDEMTVWRHAGEVTVPVPDRWHERAVLSEAEAIHVARLTRAVERAFGMPIDVEWASDGFRFWAVQARPITTLDHPGPAARWTRADLKEIFPELPSPLALSYLSALMNGMFRAFHTARGTAIPDAPLVAVFRGRPYLNLAMMERRAPPDHAAPGRVSARIRLVREMLGTFVQTPARGRRLFGSIGRQAAVLRAVPVERLDDADLIAHLERFRALLLHEHTLRRRGEVLSAQSRASMVLERMMQACADDDAPDLVGQLMTGLRTPHSARMTSHLMALATLAAGEPRARAFFEGELDGGAVARYRAGLAGTGCLAALDAFLAEFGHRGPYESDVMSARFGEDPAPVLRLVQLYVRSGTPQEKGQDLAERQQVRAIARARVRDALRRRHGRLGFATRWLAFTLVCRALPRVLALRGECRHVDTMLVAHLRRLTLEIGRRATRAGLLAAEHDAFFLSWDDLPRVLREPDRDWRGRVRENRHEREHNARLEAPDLLAGDTALEPPGSASGDDLIGSGVSPGTVTGTVTVMHSIEGVARLAGAIVVFSAMEPTLTPLFPLAGGLISENGGRLSHAAILAREYGLPAVVDVRDATRRLRDGDRVEIDGTSGRVRILERRADRLT